MLRRDAIKLLGLSGLSLGALPSSTNAGTFLPAAGEDPKNIRIDFRNSPQFIVSETDAPRHIIDFYWSPTCKYSCITAIKSIRPISLDDRLSASVAARYTMIPRYREEVAMGALMLSVPPAEYPALCFSVLSEGALSPKGYSSIEEVTKQATKMGGSPTGSSGYDAKIAQKALELAHSYYVNKLHETTTPAVYVDGRKVAIKTSEPDFDTLKEALA